VLLAGLAKPAGALERLVLRRERPAARRRAEAFSRAAIPVGGGPTERGLSPERATRPARPAEGPIRGDRVA
jgi:hypothetical protein